jgi:hypothetical protein
MNRLSPIISAQFLGAELHKRGLVPENCRQVEVVIGLDGAVIVRYEVLVRADDIPNVIDALKAIAPDVHP